MEVIIAVTAVEDIISTAAIELVVAVLSVEGVGRTVAVDNIVTAAGVDIFNGDESVTPITCVLPACGVEIDAVGTA